MTPEIASNPPVVNAAKVRGIRISHNTWLFRVPPGFSNSVISEAKEISTLPLNREKSIEKIVRTAKVPISN